MKVKIKTGVQVELINIVPGQCLSIQSAVAMRLAVAGAYAPIEEGTIGIVFLGSGEVQAWNATTMVTPVNAEVLVK